MIIEEWGGESSLPLVSHLAIAVYPPEVLATKIWRNILVAPTQHRVLLRDAGAIVGAAGFLRRTVRLDDRDVSVGGVKAVMVLPDRQGEGLGRMAVTAAMTALRREDAPAFGLLFCEPDTVGFYARLGWTAFAGEVVVDQQEGPLLYDILHCLVAPLSGPAPKNGRIDLRGLPW